MSIQLTRRDEFAVITINRPDALNALNYSMLKEIDTVLDEISHWDIRGIFFMGTGGKAFCAGADISELLDRGIPEEYAGTHLGQGVFSRIENFKVPSIAIVDGYALGGGCELALACTFRIGNEAATFGLPEVKLALVPGYGGTQRLPRLVGVAAAMDIILTGRMVKSEEALRLGLLHEIVSGDLLEAGLAYARRYSKHSLLALRLARDAILRGVDTTLQEGLRIEADLSTVSMNSEDGMEGPRAFLEKRPPRIQDK